MQVGIDIDARQSEAAEIVHPAREIDVAIFDLGAPVAAHGKFDAGAHRPARLVLPGRGNDIAGAIIDVDVAVAPGKAAGHIRQPCSERVSDATAHGADVVKRRVERGAGQRRAVQRTGERCVGFDAKHDTVRKLPNIAGLKSADQARDAMRKEYALLGKRIGAGAKTAAAITGMAAQIEAGPIEDGRAFGRLDGQVRGELRRQRERARGKHYPGATAKSAKALHDAPCNPY